MVDFMHLVLDAIMIGLSLGLAYYCLRLLKKFLHGGIFEVPIKAFLISSLFTAAGAFTNVLRDIGFKSFPIHTMHVLYVFSVVTIFYGIYMLHKAWTKIGSL